MVFKYLGDRIVYIWFVGLNEWLNKIYFVMCLIWFIILNIKEIEILCILEGRWRERIYGFSNNLGCRRVVFVYV